MGQFRDDVVALLPHLRAFARSLTAGDPHLADDLVQDTVVNALRARDSFTPGTNLRAWLFRILRNRFLSLKARRHVRAEVADEELETRWSVPACQESLIEIDAFRRAFRALSPAHREVLVLTVVHELPYEEVAEICGCAVGTVKSRVARARALLKRMLLEGEVPIDRERVAVRLPRPAVPEPPPGPATGWEQRFADRRESAGRGLLC